METMGETRNEATVAVEEEERKSGLDTSLLMQNKLSL
jgi:hypothetical protein